MLTDLYVGIAATEEGLEVAALDHGRPTTATSFPASAMGMEAIKIFLADNPVRLAIAGVAALNVALALGNAPQREVFILSSSAAEQSVALARHAERSI
ncbi:MAG: hypothetical protein PHY45_05890 [Rhodocyclaceae bacterium]|nr:hypothetical protein [Rhodocyclaceae bacterium]